MSFSGNPGTKNGKKRVVKASLVSSFIKKGRVLKGTVKALRVGSLHEKRDEP
jgi:hypothetical protein